MLVWMCAYGKNTHSYPKSFFARNNSTESHPLMSNKIGDTSRGILDSSCTTFHAPLYSICFLGMLKATKNASLRVFYVCCSQKRLIFLQLFNFIYLL